MVKKTIRLLFLFLSLLIIAGPAQARTNIPLVKDIPDNAGNDDRARLPSMAPYAFLENHEIHISILDTFPISEIPPLGVVIRDTDKTIVFTRQYPSSYEVIINLEENGIDEGEYTLYVYLQDCWWKGNFNTEEEEIESAKPAITCVEGTYYLLEKREASIIRPELAGKSSRLLQKYSKQDYPSHLVIPSKLTYKEKSYKVTSIGTSAFRYCYELRTITIPNTVKSIEDNVFMECEKLLDVRIPESVTNIGPSAFKNCYKLTSIQIPEGITTIRPFTFENCKELGFMTLPSTIRNVAPNAFKGCTGLVFISLPEGISNIGNNAFSEIPNHADIYCHAIKPFRIYSQSFNFRCTLHVPQGCKEAYQKADYWKNFALIVDDIVKKEMPGDETAVAPIVSEDAEAPAYDLLGRPVDASYKGIAIRNGKKVIIK